MIGVKSFADASSMDGIFKKMFKGILNRESPLEINLGPGSLGFFNSIIAGKNVNMINAMMANSGSPTWAKLIQSLKSYRG